MKEKKEVIIEIHLNFHRKCELKYDRNYAPKNFGAIIDFNQ